MRCRRIWLTWLTVCSLFFYLSAVGFGLITALLPLKDILSTNEFILIAKVEKIFAGKPAVVLAVAEDLKGKAPFRKLPIALTGDSEAKKEKQVPLLLKRLAPDLPLILFVSPRG
jgi:hypothetical protein